MVVINRLPQETPDTQDQFERCIFDEQVQKGAQKMYKKVETGKIGTQKVETGLPVEKGNRYRCLPVDPKVRHANHLFLQ